MVTRDQEHPFFRPLWRRIALVVLLAVWAAYEVLVSRETLWILITLAALGYAVWTFLITFPKQPDAP
ncbi:DUF3329 domain-containing protein [Prosthecomicrobium pneumaticum]|uniref:Multisubunit Na+/H+ antiporter MnhC subunit n=1 Tax=Prosthecomicrobium pneumaticum TaxID=81895 RepID=A0A7W9CT39_9HYPH|nr:DUF3329 domain-containing protein [Prosthecomicrobium pneumaticum]MBB5751400.1 multisubunit Na+/H+ antiporter MnhC subunit [Prosthecomicrobium pneumaticum]